MTCTFVATVGKGGRSRREGRCLSSNLLSFCKKRDFGVGALQSLQRLLGGTLGPFASVVTKECGGHSRCGVDAEDRTQIY